MHKKFFTRVAKLVNSAKCACELETISFTKGGHLRCVIIAGDMRYTIFKSATPSDYRADMNFVRDVRRAVNNV